MIAMIASIAMIRIPGGSGRKAMKLPPPLPSAESEHAFNHGNTGNHGDA